VKAKYDVIGVGYNNTRKADSYLTERLLSLLQPQKKGLYLDIGCGTGNYTNALQKLGYNFIGIDPSEEMLSKARAINSNIKWQTGTADNTGLDDNSIDGVIVTLTVHHWNGLIDEFKELGRVTKSGGRLVIFTSAPEQTASYWLNHYFPKALKKSVEQLPPTQKIMEALQEAGFNNFIEEKYFVKPDLQDLFLQSGKHNPSLYLNPQVRKGISTFASLANAEEVELGLKELEKDISTGKINEIIQSYESDVGDYLFIRAVKQ